jgi:hypothetical protein
MPWSSVNRTSPYAAVGTKTKIFHSRHIIDTVHFAGKSESAPLQIADACAFVIKRHLMEKEDAATFFGTLRPQLYCYEEQGLRTVQAY